MDENKQGGPSPDNGDAGEYYPEPPYLGPSDTAETAQESVAEGSLVPALAGAGGGSLPPALPPVSPDEEDEEEEQMLRMSFMEHLEELRTRIIRACWGLGIAFLVCLLFANKLWEIISEPATYALKHLGVVPPRLAMTQPMESFSIIWVKLPLLASVFVASPWIVYQVWAFISPGLYKRERRFAAPFVLSIAGLFITGGLFAYFLAFRYGLEFLLGIGMSNNVQPVVTITEYFDLFVNVTLGVGLVFEMPIVIFFLTLLHLASPRFLMRHSRYAVLAIVIIAAIVTPTPDVFNLMLFAVPMCALYFVGVFAGYLLILKREGRRFPWKKVFLVIAGVIVLFGGLAYVVIVRFGFKVLPHWPFLMK